MFADVNKHLSHIAVKWRAFNGFSTGASNQLHFVFVIPICQ
jgi:hypothetical protein